MAWFSYFLLSVPEAFFILAVSFALFGISIKQHLKSMIIFALLYGGAAFTLSIFMNNSFKPILNTIVFALLVAALFRIKFHYGFIISIIGIIFLVLFEIILLLPLTQIIPIEEIVTNPWIRILAGVLTIHIPMLITILIIQRFKLTIKTPIIKEK
jgi:hypothetical protein